MDIGVGDMPFVTASTQTSITSAAVNTQFHLQKMQSRDVRFEL